MFLIWILLGVGAYYLYKNRQIPNVQPKQKRDQALEKLSMRFANGEIDEAEYTKIKEILSE